MRKRIQKLAAGMMVLMAAGMLLVSCSSDEDDLRHHLVGYWEGERVADFANMRGGLYFSPTGEVFSWTAEGDSRWEFPECRWSISGDRVELEPYHVYPDQMYYSVVSVSEKSLVVRMYGGIGGIPYEKGTDNIYHKLKKAPGTLTERVAPGQYILGWPKAFGH